MIQTRTLTLGLLLVGATLGAAGLAPVAAAGDCVAYVYVATQGWTCVFPPETGGEPCIGYVYDPVSHTWRCIPDVRPGPLPVPDLLPLPGPVPDGCIAYVYVPTQGWTCVPPEYQGPCFGYVYDPVFDTWRCIPQP